MRTDGASPLGNIFSGTVFLGECADELQKTHKIIVIQIHAGVEQGTQFAAQGFITYVDPAKGILLLCVLGRPVRTS